LLIKSDFDMENDERMRVSKHEKHIDN